MAKLNPFQEMFNEKEIEVMLGELATDLTGEIDFEAFLRVSH